MKCYFLFVFAWLSRLFRRLFPAPPDPETPPRWAVALLAEHRASLAARPAEVVPADQPEEEEPEAEEPEEEDAPLEPPLWVGELQEALQRSARAQGKVGLRLEQVEHKLDQGLGDLQRRVSALAPPRFNDLDDLFNAIDLLDQARASIAAEHPEAAVGLDGVRSRLERYLEQAGLARHGDSVLHREPDGQRVRIVGTEERPELPEGVVTRIVRAAITRGDQLVREGAVLTNRRSLQ